MADAQARNAVFSVCGSVAGREGARPARAGSGRRLIQV
jgi:hypothetical protein